jgi:hypothetical protein
MMKVLLNREVAVASRVVIGWDFGTREGVYVLCLWLNMG